LIPPILIGIASAFASAQVAAWMYAIANGEYGRYYNGVDTKGNFNLQLGVTEFNNQDGIRYAPLKLGFHFFIIGGDVSISRSIWDVGREYNEARQEFFEKTGTAMPRR